MSDDISIPSPTYRVPRHARGMDPGTRRLALIAAGIGGFLIVVGSAWHMMSAHHGGVPVVQAEAGPMRVKPSNPGGLQVAGAGNDIFSGGSDTEVEKLAPPPQTPDPQALQQMTQPAPAAAVPAQTTGAAPMTAAAGAAPMTTAAPPAPPPAPAAQAEQTVKPAALAAAAAHPAEHAAPVAAAHASGSGKVEVQLAALSTEQAAHDEWARLERRWPELRSHQPAFSRIERDGHVFWRVRASGFGGVSDAAAFCQRLRAGGGGCSVADF